MTVSTVTLSSPVGPMRITGDGCALTRVEFCEPEMSDDRGAAGADPLLRDARRQLLGYFAGETREFDLPLALAGTAFQLRVWEQLRLIPFGVTTSYGAIAARLGMPAGAARAVGLANGANPIAIIVPCHRVIGSNGKLVGYAGGLHRKRFLLGMESPTLQEGLFVG
jgi:methylated-DNA-[protein]-cysteine S-methyltransferase